MSNSLVAVFLASALGNGVLASEKDETQQQNLQQQLAKQQEQIADLTKQLEEQKQQQAQQQEKDDKPSRGVQAREAVKDAGKKVGNIFK